MKKFLLILFCFGILLNVVFYRNGQAATPPDPPLQICDQPNACIDEDITCKHQPDMLSFGIATDTVPVGLVFTSTDRRRYLLSIEGEGEFFCEYRIEGILAGSAILEETTPFYFNVTPAMGSQAIICRPLTDGQKAVIIKLKYVNDG